MITSFVLLQVRRGQVPSVAQALLEISEVSEVYSVAGDLDLIAIIRVRHYDDIAQVVPEKLQALEGIERTTTLMAFHCYSRHDLERLFSMGLEDEPEGAS